MTLPLIAVMLVISNAAYAQATFGHQTLNGGLFKRIHLTGGHSLRVQATFTNLLNKPNFGNPNLNISTAGSVRTIRSTQSQDLAGARCGASDTSFERSIGLTSVHTAHAYFSKAW